MYSQIINSIDYIVGYVNLRIRIQPHALLNNEPTTGRQPYETLSIAEEFVFVWLNALIS